MTHTDDQLKQALAKMLPELIKIEPIKYIPRFDSMMRNVLCYVADDCEVLDTELLHLCWLAEETLSYDDSTNYCQQIAATTGQQFAHKKQDWASPITGTILHATWQQRVIALAKVKGVEIV